jgi:hypothetical protein
MVFSCGHAFVRSHFLHDVLPEFTARMNNLPRPLPLTMTFLLAEYQQDVSTEKTDKEREEEERVSACFLYL